MKTSVPLVIAAAFTAEPLLATGGIYCDGTSEDSVGAYLTVGRTAGFVVVGAHINAPDRSWSMLPDDSTQKIEFVQGAIAGDFVVADFADANIESIVVSLRLARIENEFGVVGAGVLSIPGIGTWPVACDFE